MAPLHWAAQAASWGQFEADLFHPPVEGWDQLTLRVSRTAFAAKSSGCGMGLWSPLPCSFVNGRGRHLARPSIRHIDVRGRWHNLVRGGWLGFISPRRCFWGGLGIYLIGLFWRWCCHGSGSQNGGRLNPPSRISDYRAWAAFCRRLPAGVDVLPAVPAGAACPGLVLAGRDFDLAGSVGRVG